jgi:hypothetical protein
LNETTLDIALHPAAPGEWKKFTPSAKQEGITETHTMRSSFLDHRAQRASVNPQKKKSDESAESGERKSLDDGILSIAQIAC